MNIYNYLLLLQSDYSYITYDLQPLNIEWTLSLVKEKIITGVQRGLLIFSNLSEYDLKSIPNSLAFACSYLQPQVALELIPSQLFSWQLSTVMKEISDFFVTQTIFCNGIEWELDPFSLAKGGLEPIEPPVKPEGPGNPFANTGPLGPPVDPPTNTADSHTVTGKTVADYISSERERIIHMRTHDPSYLSGQHGTKSIRDVRLSCTGIQQHPSLVSKFIEFAKSDVGKQMKSLALFNESLNNPNVRLGYRDPSYTNISITKELINHLSRFR